MQLYGWEKGEEDTVFASIAALKSGDNKGMIVGTNSGGGFQIINGVISLYGTELYFNNTKLA